MDLLSLDPSQFIVLTPVSVAFLLAVGFVVSYLTVRTRKAGL